MASEHCYIFPLLALVGYPAEAILAKEKTELIAIILSFSETVKVTPCQLNSPNQVGFAQTGRSHNQISRNYS